MTFEKLSSTSWARRAGIAKVSGCNEHDITSTSKHVVLQQFLYRHHIIILQTHPLSEPTYTGVCEEEQGGKAAIRLVSGMKNGGMAWDATRLEVTHLRLSRAKGYCTEGVGTYPRRSPCSLRAKA